MKTKYFIVGFFLCALNLISIAAIMPFKGGKQYGVSEESKTIIEVNKNEYWRKGGNHGDGYWGSWTGGGWAGGLPEGQKKNGAGEEKEGENKRGSKGEVNEPIGRNGGGENKGSEREGEYKETHP
ncbi:unnamed protein product [Lathyrus oleraceus]|uniref:Nodule-specific Glycine Rich Peptide n=1 Tax=Pisum sativum TaxID=3888 RepID=A0A9D4WNH2_PEA|nr:hypothetical protein KIW84_051756 [Pisum sativum]